MNILNFFRKTQPKPKTNLNLLYCFNCRKNVFDYDRQWHEDEFHRIEPLKGPLFTETKEYFEGVEKDADLRGELPL